MTSMGEISPAITTNLREITGKSYIDTKQCHKLHVHCSRKLFSEFLQQELNPGPSTQQSDALLLSYRRLTEATCSWPYTCNAYYSTCRFMYSVGTKRKGEDSNVTNIPFTATCTCTCRISFTSRKFKMHGHTCSTVHVLCSYFFATTILLLKQPKNMIMFPKV